MTKKLEELFDLPGTPGESPRMSTEETRVILAEVDDAIDKIDAALPGVRDLSASDSEMDDIATKASDSFDELMALGMNVDSRFAAEIFSVAGTMLGHALTAKTAKMNKKLKVIELQLKKMRLDQQATDNNDNNPMTPGEGQVLSRNELLERLIGDRKNMKKE